MMLVLHDDAELTAPLMACRDTKVGIFSRGLMDEAKKSGMKNGWKTIFREGDR